MSQPKPKPVWQPDLPKLVDLAKPIPGLDAKASIALTELISVMSTMNPQEKDSVTLSKVFKCLGVLVRALAVALPALAQPSPTVAVSVNGQQADALNKQLAAMQAANEKGCEELRLLKDRLAEQETKATQAHDQLKHSIAQEKKSFAEAVADKAWQQVQRGRSSASTQVPATKQLRWVPQEQAGSAMLVPPTGVSAQSHALKRAKQVLRAVGLEPFASGYIQGAHLEWDKQRAAPRALVLTVTHAGAIDIMQQFKAPGKLPTECKGWQMWWHLSHQEYRCKRQVKETFNEVLQAARVNQQVIQFIRDFTAVRIKQSESEGGQWQVYSLSKEQIAQLVKGA